MEAKDNRKRAAVQIKRLAASNTETADSDSDASAKVPLKEQGKDWCPTGPQARL